MESWLPWVHMKMSRVSEVSSRNRSKGPVSGLSRHQLLDQSGGALRGHQVLLLIKGREGPLRPGVKNDSRAALRRVVVVREDALELRLGFGAVGGSDGLPYTGGEVSRPEDLRLPGSGDLDDQAPLPGEGGASGVLAIGCGEGGALGLVGGHGRTSFHLGWPLRRGGRQ